MWLPSSSNLIVTSRVVVQKYGGSSLANETLIRRVATRIRDRHRTDPSLVVAVSAMGDTTDELLALAQRLAGDTRPHPREADALVSTGELVSASLVAITLRGLGVPAVSLSGRQAGIRTDTTYGSARIANVNTGRVTRELNAGNVVVVAGFQGLTETDDTTTLGRGASDLTAVALAAALSAKVCEVYTDVDGIFTADPNLVPNARVLRYIGYNEMLEMASLGAKMNPRSIEVAAVNNVNLRILSSFNPDSTGSLISATPPEDEDMEIDRPITAVTTERHVGRIVLRGIDNRPGTAAAVMMPLAEAGVSVDVIVQNVSESGLASLAFTVSSGDLANAMQLVRERSGVQFRAVDAEDGFAKVSIVGTGMVNAPGFAARTFKALADADVNIEMITTSEIRITCIVRHQDLSTAANALHAAFGLGDS